MKSDLVVMDVPFIQLRLFAVIDEFSDLVKSELQDAAKRDLRSKLYNIQTQLDLVDTEIAQFQQRTQLWEPELKQKLLGLFDECIGLVMSLVHRERRSRISLCISNMLCTNGLQTFSDQTLFRTLPIRGPNGSKRVPETSQANTRRVPNMFRPFGVPNGS